MKCALFFAILLFGLPTIASAQKTEWVAYGEADWRNNNLASTHGYQSHFGLTNTEVRLLFGDRDHADRLRPFLTLQPSLGSRTLRGPEIGYYNFGNFSSLENIIALGPGAEIRPLVNNHYLTKQWQTEWLAEGRIFVEYLRLYRLFGIDPNPNLSFNDYHRDDLVVGFDVWKEFGGVNEGSPRSDWTELYLSVAHHSTNFYLGNSGTVIFGLNIRTGGILGGRKPPIMPYVVLNVKTESHSNFFNNFSWGGIGIRTEKRFGSNAKVKLFLEQRWILLYFKDHSLAQAAGVPSSDTVAGVSFQYNRY